MARDPKKRSREEGQGLNAEASSRGGMGLHMKYLVISGKDEMKISRSLEAKVEDLSLSGLVFQTPTMKVDDLHLSYDESPVLRNKITMEIDLPNHRKVTAMGEVSWYERSFVSKDTFYHVGVVFKEMSPEDRSALRDYLVSIKRTVKAIDLDV
jgi:hypothetical protein